VSVASAGRRSAYVSDAFRSRADDMYKIGISRPILGEDGKTVVGVFVATAATDPTFGAQTFSGASRTAALVARLETEADAPQPRHIILLHEGLRHGQYVPIENPHLSSLGPDAADQLQLPARPVRVVTDPKYLDPVADLPPADGFTPSAYAGRWLAAFAPVGNTHLVVIVQTRADDAVALDRIAARRLAWLAAVALGVILTLIGLTVWTANRRPRRLTTVP